MSPKVYESWYRGIYVGDDKIGLRGSIDIKEYISGFRKASLDEWQAVLSVIAVWLKKPGPNALPARFVIPGRKDIDPDYLWSKWSLRRAYEGRAAPDEFADATRLAFATRRFRHPVSAQAYADTWFGIDCNSFVGNYCGISPSTAISAYARGYPPGSLGGASPDVFTSKDLLPHPPVRSLDDIQAGTIVLTYGTPDSRGSRWRHIALVEEFTPVVGIGGARTGGDIVLVEWGTKGGAMQHVTARKTVKVLPFACPELPGQPCLAFDGLTPPPESKPAKRIFFEAGRFDEFEVRGSHVYNGAGTRTFDT